MSISKMFSEARDAHLKQVASPPQRNPLDFEAQFVAEFEQKQDAAKREPLIRDEFLRRVEETKRDPNADVAAGR